MDRIKRARPSPASLIATLALVVAVAGTAIAGPVATTSKDKLTKNEKKKVKKLADKRIAKAESGLNVNSAKSATTATNAANATNATNADTLDGLNSTQFLGSTVRSRLSQSAPLNTGDLGVRTVACNAGETLIGGGLRFVGANNGHEVNYNAPATAGGAGADGGPLTNWGLAAVAGASDSGLVGYAVCAATS